MVSDEGFIMAVVAVAAVIISWFAVKKINDKNHISGKQGIWYIDKY